MNREEILAKSRWENKGRPDELEVVAFGKASRVGMYVGGAICIILVIVSRFLLERGDIGLAGWMIYFAMQGSSNFVLYKHLRSKEKLVSAIIGTGFAVVFFVAFAIAVYNYMVGA